MAIKRHSWNTVSFNLYVLCEEEIQCIAHNFFLSHGKFWRLF